ncbi:MAG: lysylphosphatidylglycerol synthase transmembrane domain-containing protein [Planctomycetota bacterium]
MKDQSTHHEAATDPGVARRRWWFALRVLVAAALVGLVLRLVPVGEVIAAVVGAAWGPLAGACALAAAVHAVQARRLQGLAAAVGLGWPWRRVMTIHLGAMAYGLVLPGGNLTGAAVRAVKLGRARGMMTQAAAALLVDRLLATATLGATGLVCWVAAGGSVEVSADWLTASLLVGVAVLGVLAVVPAVLGVERFIRPDRWRTVWGVGAVVGRLERVPTMSTGVVVRAAAWAVLAHGLGVLVCVLVARALEMELGVWDVGVARALLLVAALLPITVAGIGVRESAALMVLGAMGEPGGESVAFALVFFVVMWVLPAVVGAVLEVIGGRVDTPAKGAEFK